MAKLAISKTYGCQRFERGEAISVFWLCAVFLDVYALSHAAMVGVTYHQHGQCSERPSDDAEIVQRSFSAVWRISVQQCK